MPWYRCGVRPARRAAAEVKIGQDRDAVAAVAFGPAFERKGLALQAEVIDTMQHAPDEGHDSRGSGGRQSKSPEVHALTIGKSLTRRSREGP